MHPRCAQRGGKVLNIDSDMNGNRENPENMDQLSMEQLMESSLQTLREGEVVRGTVVAVTNDEVMVDIGFKCEGSIPISEFTDRTTGEVMIGVDWRIQTDTGLTLQLGAQAATLLPGNAFADAHGNRMAAQHAGVARLGVQY